MKHIKGLTIDIRDSIRRHFSFLRAFALGIIAWQLVREGISKLPDELVLIGVFIALWVSILQESPKITSGSFHGLFGVILGLHEGICIVLLSIKLQQPITGQYAFYYVLSLTIGLPVIIYTFIAQYLNDPSRVRHSLYSDDKNAINTITAQPESVFNEN